MRAQVSYLCERSGQMHSVIYKSGKGSSIGDESGDNYSPADPCAVACEEDVRRELEINFYITVLRIIPQSGAHGELPSRRDFWRAVRRRVLRSSDLPSTAMPPSPTAAAQRFTEPERTSPAAKMPGQLVSRGPGERPMPFHAAASTTAWPVLMKPFSSRSISGGSQAVHGLAPIIEKTAGVCKVRRSCVFAFSSSTASRTFPPIIFRISVCARISIFSFASSRLLVHASPLLEEEGDVVVQALSLEGLYPIFLHRSCSRPAFPADDKPIDVFHVRRQIDIAQQWLGADECYVFRQADVGQVSSSLVETLLVLG